MKIIPFRITASEEPDNYNTLYNFLIKGTNKDPYEVQIEIDQFNDLGLIESRCTCPHFTFRQEECKHIKGCKDILIDFGIKLDIDTEQIGEPMKTHNEFMKDVEDANSLPAQTKWFCFMKINDAVHAKDVKEVDSE